MEEPATKEDSKPKSTSNADEESKDTMKEIDSSAVPTEQKEETATVVEEEKSDATQAGEKKETQQQPVENVGDEVKQEQQSTDTNTKENEERKAEETGKEDDSTSLSEVQNEKDADTKEEVEKKENAEAQEEEEVDTTPISTTMDSSISASLEPVMEDETAVEDKDKAKVSGKAKSKEGKKKKKLGTEAANSTKKQLGKKQNASNNMPTKSTNKNDKATSKKKKEKGAQKYQKMANASINTSSKRRRQPKKAFGRRVTMGLRQVTTGDPHKPSKPTREKKERPWKSAIRKLKRVAEPEIDPVLRKNAITKFYQHAKGPRLTLGPLLQTTIKAFSDMDADADGDLNTEELQLSLQMLSGKIDFRGLFETLIKAYASKNALNQIVFKFEDFLNDLSTEETKMQKITLLNKSIVNKWYQERSQRKKSVENIRLISEGKLGLSDALRSQILVHFEDLMVFAHDDLEEENALYASEDDLRKMFQGAGLHFSKDIDGVIETGEKIESYHLQKVFLSLERCEEIYVSRKAAKTRNKTFIRKMKAKAAQQASFSQQVKERVRMEKEAIKAFTSQQRKTISLKADTLKQSADAKERAVVMKAQQYAQKRMARMRDFFRKMDVDHSDTVDKDEIRLGLKLIGSDYLTDEEIESLFQHLDSDKSGSVDVNEFHKIFKYSYLKRSDAYTSTEEEFRFNKAMDDLRESKRATNRTKKSRHGNRHGPSASSNPDGHGETFIKSITGTKLRKKDIFMKLDKNGDGLITEEEIIEGMKKLHVRLRKEDVHDIFSQIDHDGSGEVDIAEFLSLFSKSRRTSRASSGASSPVLSPRGKRRSSKINHRKKEHHEHWSSNSGAGHMDSDDIFEKGREIAHFCKRYKRFVPFAENSNKKDEPNNKKHRRAQQQQQDKTNPNEDDKSSFRVTIREYEKLAIDFVTGHGRLLLDVYSMDNVCRVMNCVAFDSSSLFFMNGERTACHVSPDNAFPGPFSYKLKAVNLDDQNGTLGGGLTIEYSILSEFRKHEFLRPATSTDNSSEEIKQESNNDGY
eukprot:g3549.t1